jgi:hypothetical protein
MRTPWLLCLGVVFGAAAALGADGGARVVKRTGITPGKDHVFSAMWLGMIKVR